MGICGHTCILNFTNSVPRQLSNRKKDVVYLRGIRKWNEPFRFSGHRRNVLGRQRHNVQLDPRSGNNNMKAGFAFTTSNNTRFISHSAPASIGQHPSCDFSISNGTMFPTHFPGFVFIFVNCIGMPSIVCFSSRSSNQIGVPPLESINCTLNCSNARETPSKLLAPNQWDRSGSEWRHMTSVRATRVFQARVDDRLSNAIERTHARSPTVVPQRWSPHVRSVGLGTGVLGGK